MNKRPEDYYNSQTRKNDYDSVFNGEMGERVLEDLLEYCHLLPAPMPDSDPNNALVREARRDVGNMILSAMIYQPQREKKDE